MKLFKKYRSTLGLVFLVCVILLFSIGPPDNVISGYELILSRDKSLPGGIVLDLQRSGLEMLEDAVGKGFGAEGTRKVLEEVLKDILIEGLDVRVEETGEGRQKEKDDKVLYMDGEDMDASPYRNVYDTRTPEFSISLDNLNDEDIFIVSLDIFDVALELKIDYFLGEMELIDDGYATIDKLTLTLELDPDKVDVNNLNGRNDDPVVDLVFGERLNAETSNMRIVPQIMELNPPWDEVAEGLVQGFLDTITETIEDALGVAIKEALIKLLRIEEMFPMDLIAAITTRLAYNCNNYAGTAKKDWCTTRDPEELRLCEKGTHSLPAYDAAAGETPPEDYGVLSLFGSEIDIGLYPHLSMDRDQESIRLRADLSCESRPGQGDPPSRVNAPTPLKTPPPSTAYNPEDLSITISRDLILQTLKELYSLRVLSLQIDEDGLHLGLPLDIPLPTYIKGMLKVENLSPLIPSLAQVADPESSVSISLSAGGDQLGPDRCDICVSVGAPARDCKDCEDCKGCEWMGRWGGKTVSEDEHDGYTGDVHDENTYVLDLQPDDYLAGSEYQICGRVCAASDDGVIDSEGEVLLRTPQGVIKGIGEWKNDELYARDLSDDGEGFCSDNVNKTGISSQVYCFKPGSDLIASSGEYEVTWKYISGEDRLYITSTWMERDPGDLFFSFNNLFVEFYAEVDGVNRRVLGIKFDMGGALNMESLKGDNCNQLVLGGSCILASIDPFVVDNLEILYSEFLDEGSTSKALLSDTLAIILSSMIQAGFETRIKIANLTFDFSYAGPDPLAADNDNNRYGDYLTLSGSLEDEEKGFDIVGFLRLLSIGRALPCRESGGGSSKTPYSISYDDTKGMGRVYQDTELGSIRFLGPSGEVREGGLVELSKEETIKWGVDNGGGIIRYTAVGPDTGDEEWTYTWRLDGGFWHRPARSSYAALGGLPGGEHLIEVMAFRRDTRGDSIRASLKFHVDPRNDLPGPDVPRGGYDTKGAGGVYDKVDGKAGGRGDKGEFGCSQTTGFKVKDKRD